MYVCVDTRMYKFNVHVLCLYYTQLPCISGLMSITYTQSSYMYENTCAAAKHFKDSDIIISHKYW